MSSSSSEFSAVDKGTPRHPIDPKTQSEQPPARPGEDDDEPVTGVRSSRSPQDDPVPGAKRLAGPRTDEDDAELEGDRGFAGDT